MSRAETIHPKISAIQEHLNRIDEFTRRRDYLSGLRESYLTIVEMSPTDRPHELETEIRKEIKTLNAVKIMERHRLYSEREWKFLDIFKKLSDCLWSKRYFLSNKYGMSKSLKELRAMVGDNRPVEGEDDLDDE